MNWMYFQNFRKISKTTRLCLKPHVVPHIRVPRLQVDPLVGLPLKIEKSAGKAKTVLSNERTSGRSVGVGTNTVCVQGVSRSENIQDDQKVVMVIPPGSYNFIKVVREGEDEEIPEEQMCRTQ